MPLNIEVKTVPHDQQRYETPGDWFDWKDGYTLVRVSALKDWRHEFLVAIHELVEWAICRHRGIPEQAVMDFDVQFEAERRQGKHGEDTEPGDDPRAPYNMAHFLATVVERMVAFFLRVDWAEYDLEVGRLSQNHDAVCGVHGPPCRIPSNVEH